MKPSRTKPTAKGRFDDMAGAYAAMITPFTKDDKLDEGAIEQLVEYGIASGLRGFYLTGGTGEFTLMTVEERKRLYRRAAKAAAGRCKLIAHVGATRTDDAHDTTHKERMKTMNRGVTRLGHAVLAVWLTASLVTQAETFYLKSDNAASLTNPAYWTNMLGEAATEFLATDKYVISPQSYGRTATPVSGATFAGGELQLGSTYGTGSLNLRGANGFQRLTLFSAVTHSYEGAYTTNRISGNIVVSNETVRWTRSDIGDCSGQVQYFTGTLTGDAASRITTDIRFAAETGSRYEALVLDCDCTGFHGTVKIVLGRATNGAKLSYPDYWAKLELAAENFMTPADIQIARGCLLDVNTASASIKSLEMGDTTIENRNASDETLLKIVQKPGGSGLVVTDAMTIGSDVTLEVVLAPRTGHLATNTCPIFTVPHASAVDWSRIRVVHDALPVPGSCIAVMTNTVAGTETLVLIEPPCIRLVASDEKTKSIGSSQDNSSAFEKATSWSDNNTPHDDADYLVECLDGESTYIRTIAERTDQSFQGRSLSIARDCIFVTWATRLTLPTLRLLDGARLWTAQEVSTRTAILDASVEIPAACTVGFGPYNWGRLTLEGSLAGSGTLVIEGVTTGTGNRQGYCRLCGDNSGFLGRIRIRQHYSQGSYGLDKNGQYLEFDHANALGGTLATFDDEALTVARLGYLTPLASVTLDASSKRGLYVTENGAVNVTNAETELTVNWPLKIDGAMQKLGLGTLALGGTLTTNGNCRLDVMLGAIRARAPNSMDGLTLAFSPDSTLLFDLADMPEGGMRNLAATPFELANGMTELPVVVKGDALCPLMERVEVPLVTVSLSVASALRSMWPSAAPHPYRGCKAQWTFSEDLATQTFTVGVLLKPIGTTFIMR